jgi:hypothetical protein
MVPWVHENTATTQFEATIFQIKCRAAGFSKTGVSELFSLFERFVQLKLKATGIYVHNGCETALTAFKITGKVIREKRNMADLVNV